MLVTAAPSPPIPSGLSALATADLARSGITGTQAETLGIYSVENALAEICYDELRPEPALVIPYYRRDGKLLTFDRDGEALPFCRVRYLAPSAPKLGFTGPEKPARYCQPARSGVHVYFPRFLPWDEIAADPQASLLIVEGEKKAAVAALLGYNAIGIGGCWNFRQDGALSGLKDLLPELEPFISPGRTVVIAMDGDAATNKNVAAAECQIALECGTRRGADVYRARFPLDKAGKRLGLDDYVVAYGEAALETLLEGAEKMCAADAAVAEVNQKHALICIGGKTWVMRTEFDATLGRRRLSFFSRRDFKDAYANRLVASPSNPAKQVSLADVWFQHPHRREYLDGLTLAPLREVPDGVFNLWRGFSVEPAPGDWSLMLAHIGDNVCSGNSDCREYLLNWMARLVQSPGEAGQVAVVLRGGRGVGKGVVASALGRLINDHYIHALQADHVTGKFNGHLQDCVYLFGDEAFFAGNPAHEKILNGLITESTRLSEQKFQSAITVPNYVHLILSTNSDFAVPAAIDERRYFVQDVPDHAHKQDTVYFGAIAAQMAASGYAAMLYDLQRRDISKFDVRRVPQTAALADQKRHTLHARGGTLAWLQDVLTAGEIKHLGDHTVTLAWGEHELLVSRTDFFDAYEAWERKRPGRVYPDSRETFGKRLQACLGASFQGGDNVKLPKRLNADRPRAYWLAPLADCRAAFRESQNMPSLWGADDA